MMTDTGTAVTRRYFLLLMLTVILCSLFPVRLSAQGCSDAGVCTVPSLRSTAGRTETVQYLQIGISYGRGERDLTALGMSLQYGRMFGKDVSVDAKGTFSSNSTTSSSASGFGDISLSASVLAADNVMLLAGIKLPLGSGNQSENSMPLPMDFQPSLGTVDIVAGLTYSQEYLQLSAAVQQPIRQNKNAFVAGSASNTSGLDTYQTTSGFSRSGDVMLRLSVPLLVDRSWSVTPAAVPIYHLADDAYTDSTGIQRAIPGSRGLTLNAALFVRYDLMHGNAVEMNVGFPLITRTARPDGLSRAFVVTAEYRMEL